MDQLEKSLERLVALPGPPGFEGEVRDFLVGEIDAWPRAQWVIDGAGNLLVRVEGRSPSAKKVLFDAHMDEPCFLVKYIDKRGFLYFAQLGFVMEPVMQGQPVRVHGRKGPIDGAFGFRSFHLSDPRRAQDGLSFEDMWIDIGADSRESAIEAGVRPGSPVTFAAFMKPLRDGCIMGRAMDNRTGCALALELARATAMDPPPGDVFFSFSVQEELILRGSVPVARGVERFFGGLPDIAVVFDICTAGDFPGVPEQKAPIELNKGPGIKIYDRSAKYHYSHVTPLGLVEEFERIARERSIPFQYDLLPGSTTIDILSLEGTGILAGGVSVPCRYTHSPVEIICMRDLEHALTFSKAVVEEADAIFGKASLSRGSANSK